MISVCDMCSGQWMSEWTGDALTNITNTQQQAVYRLTIFAILGSAQSEIPYSRFIYDVYNVYC